MAALSLESFVTRTVSLARPPVELRLSQSLFSSHEVDRGSSLLIRSIERSLPAGSAPRVLDVGSGTGVIGICLARLLPGARVWFQDRDALAVAFTEMNCDRNGVKAERVQGELALQGLGDRSFDLIVSNLPAKAGESVHAELLRRACRRLEPDGLACFVVVRPIEERIAACLAASGFTAERVASSGTHVVFHARRSSPDVEERPDALGCYVRARESFGHGSARREMDVAYDLPEFDTPSHTTALALEMLDRPEVRERLGSSALLWNPGQGHVAVALEQAARREGAGPRLTLAGRDLLSLRISRRNSSTSPDIAHVWDPAAAGAGPWALVILFPEDEPHVKWESYLGCFARDRLERDGVAIVSSGTTFASRLLRSASGLELRRSRRKEGARCVLLRRS